MINSWSYLKEYKSLRKRLLKSVDNTLMSGQLFFGKQMIKFEKNFIKTNKLKFGVSVGSGTDAIYIALLALDISNGDEVLTVSNTAIPTVSAIRSTGANVKFVDVNENYLIDVKKIEKLITNKTKVIIPVHLYGLSCDMDSICKLARKYNLKVIEDCAQAQGAKYKGKNVGTFGDAGCFSFYPTKILGAYGDGGFISTNSFSLLKKVRRIRFYGIEQNDHKNPFNKKYFSNEHGINSRLDEIQSTILNIKLSKVNSWIKKRSKLAQIYSRELKKTSLRLPSVPKDLKHVFHLYVVFHKKREIIIKKLNKNGIKININYPFPIHKMKAYKKNKNVKFKNLTNTEAFSKGIFSLPLYPDLDEKKILKITKIIKKTLKVL